jgi:hypothetical protein
MAYQPKSYRKFVATAATATLVATAIAPAALAASSFTDVAPKYKEAVDYLFDNGITKGKTEELFGTHQNITRGELAIWLTRALGLETAGAAPSGFADTAGTYYDAHVSVLKEEGILDGLSADKFGVNDYVTRGQMAKLLSNAYGLTSDEVAPFSDMGQWAPFINGLYAYEITSGKTETTFGTAENITRGDLAIFLFRADSLLVEDLAPEFNYEGEETIAVAYGAEFTAPVVTATDDIDEEVEVVSVITDAAGNELQAIDTKKPGTYTITYTAEDSAGNVSELELTVVVAEAVTPAVESVSAINANEILVTFNKELNETSAETIANYSIDTVALKGSDVVTLNADKKSVTITLGTDGTGVLTDGLLDNNTAYEVAVAKGLLAADNTEMEAKQSKTLLFIDKAAPVLNSISSLENGNIVLTFNERLEEGTKPYIVLNEVTVSASNVTVNADGTVTIAAADSAVVGLESGKSYTAVVSGAEDLIGNTMELVTKTFTYTVKNAEPTLLTAKADGETSIELKFDEALLANLADNSTVKVFKGSTQITSTPTTGDNITFDLALDYDDVFAAGETSANITVVVEGYKDAQGNVGQKVTKNVTLTKDVTKPTVTKAVYDAATGYVTLTFSEGLDAATQAVYAPKLFVTDVNGVKYDVTTTDGVATELVTLADVTAGDKTITFDAGDFVNGTYALTIQAGAFTDEANTVNGIATTTVNFTKGNATDADAPTFDSAVEVVKGQFTATFSEPVKGGAVSGSATDLANYKLNGAALPAGTTIYLNEAKTVATITLPEGAIAASGVKLLTVSNVQDVSGKVMTETTRTVSLTENTKPVLQSAKVINNGELELTFSEKVSDAASLDFSDFEVTVNGVAVTEAVGVTAASATNKFVITVSDANLATGTIVVKVSDTADATDFAGNEIVTGTTVTATR